MNEIKLHCPHCRCALPEVKAPFWLLKRAVKKAGSQAKLMRHLGVSQALYSKWVLSKNIPHIRQIQLLDFLVD
jgi:hypothetical protein